MGTYKFNVAEPPVVTVMDTANVFPSAMVQPMDLSCY